MASWIMDSAVIETEEIDAAELLSDAAKGTEVRSRMNDIIINKWKI